MNWSIRCWFCGGGSIYKTGVEVEAMHGAAIAALTIYDMLKPIDNGIEITSIKLESKHGGKSEIGICVGPGHAVLNSE